MSEIKQTQENKNSNQSRKSFITGEVFNAITHGIGVGLAITALVLLIVKAVQVHNATKLVAFIIYGISLIILFLASTLYHSLIFTKASKVFQKIDHSSIYALIAGSYTPLCLLGIGGKFGITMCVVIWIFSIVGMILEILFMEKFKKVSVFFYLILGWLVIFTIKPLYESMGTTGIVFLFLGGLSYTLGTIFYKKQKQSNWFHVVWHLFVLAGAIFMFFAIFKFL